MLSLPKLSQITVGNDCAHDWKKVHQTRKDVKQNRRRVVIITKFDSHIEYENCYVK